MRFAAFFAATSVAAFAACIGDDPDFDTTPRCGESAPCGAGLECVSGRCVVAEGGDRADSATSDGGDARGARKAIAGVWSADLLAYWPFDDDGRDYGPNQFDLTLTGASFEKGVTNGALRRASTTIASGTKDDALLDLTSGSFTVQLWTYLDVDTDAPTVLLNKAAGSEAGGWKVVKSPSPDGGGDAGGDAGAWDFTFGTTPGLQSGSAAGTFAGPTKSWVHLVFVLAEPSNEMTVYRNGVATGTAPITRTAAKPGTRLRVGESVISSSMNLVGLVDEVAIWKRAMNPVEVSSLYGQGKGVSLFAPPP